MKKWASIIAGVVLVVLLFGGISGYAKSVTQKISARFANIQLIINGKAVETKAEPFIYNGNVYAPVATVANALGIQQEWDNRTPAVRFSDTDTPLQGDDAEHGCQFSAMGKDQVYLITCGRGAARPDGFYLQDHGKRVRFPFTGETIIESVSPFVSLVDPGKSNELIIQERDTRNYSKVYLTVYSYQDGQFTRIDALQNEAATFDRLGRSEFILSNDGGETVYLVETHGEGQNVQVATKMYRWDRENLKYQAMAESESASAKGTRQ